MSRLPAAFERCTYVHMANFSLFALIIFWQPIAIEVWNVGRGFWHQATLAVFAAGWLVLFLGAWSFGIFELLGLKQMRAWTEGRPTTQTPLKTRGIYQWLSHPMYVGVLAAIWAAPRMTIGHLLLAVGLSLYVLIAMRYEERDLVARYGARYTLWRS